MAIEIPALVPALRRCSKCSKAMPEESKSLSLDSRIAILRGAMCRGDAVEPGLSLLMMVMKSDAPARTVINMLS